MLNTRGIGLRLLTDRFSGPLNCVGLNHLVQYGRFPFAGGCIVRLLEEILPESERANRWPTKKAEEPEETEETVEKNDEPDERDAQIEKLNADLTETREALVKAKREIEERPEESNLAQVEKSEAGVKLHAWPHDLNDPEVDEWTDQ